MLWSHSSHSKPCLRESPLEVSSSLGLLKPMPIGYVRHHSHVCHMNTPLPFQGSPRSCFALLRLSQDLLIRPDLIYYIVGSIATRGFKLFKFLRAPLDPSFPLSVCVFSIVYTVVYYLLVIVLCFCPLASSSWNIDATNTIFAP